jgi:hypothetical protein
MNRNQAVESRMSELSESARARLELVARLLQEVLAGQKLDQTHPSVPRIDFDSTCMKCGGAIHWTRTTANDRAVALEDREGPYHLTAEGRAEWRGSGGFAYHYDGSPDGCPAQIAPPQPHSDTRELAPDWQSIYD